MTSRYEQPLRDALRDHLHSASHSIAHLEQVMQYGLNLAATYGGDTDVITAAALLHDLGRNDKTLQGAVSAQRSADVATALLEAVDFPADRREMVLQAIAEHDQPSLRPTTLEGRILKDADFLAGFGAVGIARSALWTGESGGTMQDLIYRLEHKMPARIASLEFEQSRQQAAQEYVFVRVFLEKLKPSPPAPSPEGEGNKSFYIVIEGISGSGKSTQARMLAERFAGLEQGAMLLHEPTPWFKETRRAAPINDRTTQLVLLLADRALHLRPQIEAARAANQPVISDRSYLSTMVYQGGEGWFSPANIAYVHGLLPQPTHLFLLDVSAETAMRRIEARGGERGTHETPDQLVRHREAFKGLMGIFPMLRVLDAEHESAEGVHEAIWAEVRGQKI